jgi:hypothetical protein
MENHQQPQHRLPSPPASPRPFVYRSAQPDSAEPHPLRRATDAPHPFRAIAGEISPNVLHLKFRVYMKIN